MRLAPGHTRGSVMFSLDLGEAPGLLVGDVLFAGSIGRVDLPGGCWERCWLPAGRHPSAGGRDRRAAGHGPATTIGRERATNPYLRGPAGRRRRRPEACERMQAGGEGGGCARSEGGVRRPAAGPAPFLAVRDALIAPPRLAGYGYVEAPVFEPTELFARGVGETTDVVTKEMFAFSTGAAAR